MIVKNQFGCADTIKHIIEVKDDFVFYAPNAFTPNNDGVNDVFLPKGIGFDENSFNFFIYDRWGNMIFYSDDSAKGWDGRVSQGKVIAEEDVYVWKVDLKDIKGNTHKYIGSVTIVK